MPYLSVANFWKYQNADVWKKSKTHPPWFKYYVHRDRELDALPIAARLLWIELLATATRYQNVLGAGPSPQANPDLNGSEAKLRESERNLRWICSEVRMEPEVVAEMLPLLVKGGWLSETATPRRSRNLSRNSLEDSGAKDVDVDVRPRETDPKNGKRDARRIATMIQNGVIHDEVDLAAEIAGSKVSAAIADELRATLEEKVNAL